MVADAEMKEGIGCRTVEAVTESSPEEDQFPRVEIFGVARVEGFAVHLYQL